MRHARAAIRNERGGTVAVGEAVEGPVPVRSWLMLAASSFAQFSSSAFVGFPVFVVPVLRAQYGLTLGEAGLMASSPMLGGALTIVAWGAASDRFGERRTLLVGLGLTIVAIAATTLPDGAKALGLMFFLGGMAAFSTNAASGRVVLAWFPPRRRGAAMGLRHMSTPLGTVAVALTVPGIAENHGIRTAMLVPLTVVVAAAVVCAVWLKEPRSPDEPSERAASSSLANPYRTDTFLLRIHASSMCLVVPQAALATFGFAWLVIDQDWSSSAAGLVVGLTQLLGAASRILIGLVSDAVGSRTRPMRWAASASLVATLLLAGGDQLGWTGVGVLFVAAASLSQSPNGLAFTAVAEGAGMDWAGRVMGLQNMGQFAVGSVAAPATGVVIERAGYPIGFVTAGIFCGVALLIIPRGRPVPGGPRRG